MPDAAKWAEVAFNAVYLLVAWLLFIIMIRNYAQLPPARKQAAFWIPAALFVLAFGDSFHLIPRIYDSVGQLLNGGVDAAAWVAFGRAASSYTVTLFYLFLALYVWRRFNLDWSWVMWLMVVAFAARLVLMLSPQNDWMGTSNNGWKLYRNIPLVVQGAGVVALFLQNAPSLSSPGTRWLRGAAYAVIASFVFYAATLIGISWNPIWGTMMIPKTIAYVIAMWYLYRLELQPK